MSSLTSTGVNEEGITCTFLPSIQPIEKIPSKLPVVNYYNYQIKLLRDNVYMGVRIPLNEKTTIQELMEETKALLKKMKKLYSYSDESSEEKFCLVDSETGCTRFYSDSNWSNSEITVLEALKGNQLKNGQCFVVVQGRDESTGK